MSQLGKINSVAVIGPGRLEIGWDDGRPAQVDLSAVIAKHAALAPLRDPATFDLVKISEDGWSLEWPSGIDFGAAQLRRWADEQSGALMSLPAFKAWIDRHGLTLDEAARALGLSRRTIAYYRSGEQPIPKTVLLATEGYSARVDAETSRFRPL
jgi:hypothetical protein